MNRIEMSSVLIAKEKGVEERKGGAEGTRKSGHEMARWWKVEFGDITYFRWTEEWKREGVREREK